MSRRNASRHGACGLLRKYGRVALLLLALFVMPAGSVEPGTLPGILEEDDRVPRDSVEWPWAAIGRLNRATGGFCTATLVGPRHVLTAAHCLYDRRARRIAAADIHFVAGYRRGAHLAHSVAQHLILPEGYRPGVASAPDMLAKDWALVVLRDALPIRPISTQAPRADGKLGRIRVLRAGYSQDRAHLLSVHEGCRITGASADDGLLLHTCDATRGDSGSPLLLRTEEGVRLVGLDVGAARIDGVDHGLAVSATGFDAALRGVLDGT